MSGGGKDEDKIMFQVISMNIKNDSAEFPSSPNPTPTELMTAFCNKCTPGLIKKTEVINAINNETYTVGFEETDAYINGFNLDMDANEQFQMHEEANEANEANIVKFVILYYQNNRQTIYSTTDKIYFESDRKLVYTKANSFFKIVDETSEYVSYWKTFNFLDDKGAEAKPSGDSSESEQAKSESDKKYTVNAKNIEDLTNLIKTGNLVYYLNCIGKLSETPAFNDTNKTDKTQAKESYKTFLAFLMTEIKLGDTEDDYIKNQQFLKKLIENKINTQIVKNPVKELLDSIGDYQNPYQIYVNSIDFVKIILKFTEPIFKDIIFNTWKNYENILNEAFVAISKNLETKKKITLLSEQVEKKTARPKCLVKLNSTSVKQTIRFKPEIKELANGTFLNMNALRTWENLSTVEDSNGTDYSDDKTCIKTTFGPFDKIFDNDKKNNKIAEELSSEIFNVLDKTGIVLIVGWGASGAGKTSSLIYFNKTNNVDEQTGVIVHLCNMYCDNKNIKNITVQCVELCNDAAKDTQDKCRTNADKKYDFTRKTGEKNFMTTKDIILTHTKTKADSKETDSNVKMGGGTMDYNQKGGTRPKDLDEVLKRANEINDNIDKLKESSDAKYSADVKDSADVKEDQQGAKNSAGEKESQEQSGGKSLGEILKLLLTEDRKIEATPNNPISSRSHVVVTITFTVDNKTKKIIIGEFAGYENIFDCTYPINFANLLEDKNIDGSEQNKYYFNENEGIVKTRDDIFDFSDLKNLYKYVNVNDKSKPIWITYIYDVLTNFIFNNKNDINTFFNKFVTNETNIGSLINTQSLDKYFSNNSEGENKNAQFLENIRREMTKYNNLKNIITPKKYKFVTNVEKNAISGHYVVDEMTINNENQYYLNLGIYSFGSVVKPKFINLNELFNKDRLNNLKNSSGNPMQLTNLTIYDISTRVEYMYGDRIKLYNYDDTEKKFILDNENMQPYFRKYKKNYCIVIRNKSNHQSIYSLKIYFIIENSNEKFVSNTFTMESYIKNTSNADVGEVDVSTSGSATIKITNEPDNEIFNTKLDDEIKSVLQDFCINALCKQTIVKTTISVNKIINNADKLKKWNLQNKSKQPEIDSVLNELKNTNNNSNIKFYIVSRLTGLPLEVTLTGNINDFISKDSEQITAEKMIESWGEQDSNKLKTLKDLFVKDANKILDLVKEHRNTIEFAKKKCGERKTEGTFINNALTNFNLATKACYSFQNNGQPILPRHVPGNDFFEGKHTFKVLDPVKYEGETLKNAIESSIIMKKIFELCEKDGMLGTPTESQPHALYENFAKKMYVVFFCVFNLSVETEKDNKIQYIDINPLYELLQRVEYDMEFEKSGMLSFGEKKGKYMDIVNEEVTKINGVCKKHNIYTGYPNSDDKSTAVRIGEITQLFESIKNQMDLMNSAEQFETFKGFVQPLREMIDSINRINMITPLGTLQTVSQFSNGFAKLVKPI